MSYSPNPEKGYLAFSLIAIFFVCLVASCSPALASDVEDVFKTETVQIPHTQRVCNDVYHGGDRTGDTLKGAIIGGIIGNNVGDVKNGGALGAVIGGMLGHSNSDAEPNVITQCRNHTTYSTETRRVYSHSIVTFFHNGRHYKLRFQK